jgi:hypothetical protein
MNKLVKVYDQRTTDALIILEDLTSERERVLWEERYSETALNLGCIDLRDPTLVAIREEKWRLEAISVPVGYYLQIKE